MKERLRSVIAALVAIIGGIVLAFLGPDWIEMRLGLDPDGGNGAVECLLTAVPLVLGLIIAAGSVRRLMRGDPALDLAVSPSRDSLE